MPLIPSPSVMPQEVARFDALGDAWWDEDGPMAPLHRLNPDPDRLGARYNRAAFPGLRRRRPAARRRRPPRCRLRGRGCSPNPWRGSARMSSASIRRRPRSRSRAPTPRRPAPASPIASARSRAWPEEAAVRRGQRDGGDRHAADPTRFVAAAASLVKPGGLFIASTLNRTLELRARHRRGQYVLRWLEPGTHRWEQFVTPVELTAFARAAGLRRMNCTEWLPTRFRRNWRCCRPTPG